MSVKTEVAERLARTMGKKPVAKVVERAAPSAAVGEVALRARRKPYVAPVDAKGYSPMRDPKVRAGEPFVVPVTGDNASRSIAGKAVVVQKPNSSRAVPIEFSPRDIKRIQESLFSGTVRTLPVQRGLKRITNTDLYTMRPDEIAALAASRTAPEDPILREVFGVTRRDLRDMDMEMANSGQGMDFYDVLPHASRRPRNNPLIDHLYSGANAQRLVDTMAESQKYGDLYDGMVGWYQMQPLYDRFKLIWGDKAPQKFSEFNAFTGMASSGSDVVTELNRGSGAYMAHTNPNYDINDFFEYGGNASNSRPDWMANISGHPFHSTAHSKPMRKFIDAGAVDMDSAKVPSYIYGLGVPDTGFQRGIPVADAHFARASGLPDIRDNWMADLKNATLSEVQALTAPYTRNVADQLGLAPVQAQALQWGAYAPLTGVETLIGAPKLEILADMARRTGQRMGVSPRDALDAVIRGEANLGDFNANVKGADEF